MFFTGCVPADPADPVLPQIPTGATRIHERGGTIDLIVSGDSTQLTDAALADWVRTAANAVGAYFGKFPVPYVRITVRLRGGGRVEDGMTDDDGIRVRVGRRTRPSDLRGDWIMTHEMFHLAFPDMDQRYIWLREGLASYLEPLARARVGGLSARHVWLDLVEGLPQGQPEPGDLGLDRTHTWGRTYWGGSMFCLLADVEIRRRTGNRRSLDDAMRAVLDQGGDRFHSWTMQRVLDVCDRATGTTVMSELYQQMALHPYTADLTALWKQLGVIDTDGEIRFDDSAPLAHIRLAMTSSKSNPAAARRQ